MYEEKFVKRLISLRMQKGVSARDMSLSIGQSESYINKIENGVALPSMSVFFSICQYFGITPGQFFQDGMSCPQALASTLEDLNELTPTQLEHVRSIIKDIKR